MPLVFTNAVHIAIDCGAADVLRLLLRYGVPPNRPGIPGAVSTNSATHGGGSKSTKPSPKVSPTGQNLDKRSSLSAGYTTSPRYSPRASPRGSPKCSRSGSPRPLSPLAGGGDRTLQSASHDSDRRLRPMLVRQAGSEIEDRVKDRDMKLNFRADTDKQYNARRDPGKKSPSDISGKNSLDLKAEFEERKVRHRQEEEVRKRQASAVNYDEEVKKRESANEKLRRDIEEAMRIRDTDEKQRIRDEEASKALEEEEDKDKFDHDGDELESIPEMNPKTIPEDPSLEEEETNQEKRDGDDKKAVSRRVSWVPEVAEKSGGGGSREKPAYKRRHSAIVRRAVVTFQRQRSFSLDSQQVRTREQ